MAESLVGSALRVGRACGLVSRPGPPRRPARRGPALSPGRDPEGLTTWQAQHAQWRLDALRPSARRAVSAALEVARPHERPHLRRAVAAGHPAAAVLDLAATAARRSPDWAARRLTLLDDELGPRRRFGTLLDQVDGTTCGSAVALMLAASGDPLLALALTTPDFDEDGVHFEERFDRRQLAIHRQTNQVWPAALGTSPWGLVRWLRRHATGVGPYRVRLLDDGSAVDLRVVVAEVDAALNLGDPVPLLVGDRVPRHYVLALSRDGDDWRVYDPSSGEVRAVPVAHARERRLARLLWFDHLQAVFLPRR